MKAEEVLEKQGFKIMCHQKDDDVLHDVLIKPLIEAMEEYAHQEVEKAQDELIEEIMKRMEEWVSSGVIDPITVEDIKRIKKIFKSLK